MKRAKMVVYFVMAALLLLSLIPVPGVASPADESPPAFARKFTIPPDPTATICSPNMIDPTGPDGGAVNWWAQARWNGPMTLTIHLGRYSQQEQGVGTVTVSGPGLAAPLVQAHDWPGSMTFRFDAIADALYQIHLERQNPAPPAVPARNYDITAVGARVLGQNGPITMSPSGPTSLLFTAAAGEIPQIQFTSTSSGTGVFGRWILRDAYSENVAFKDVRDPNATGYDFTMAPDPSMIPPTPTFPYPDGTIFSAFTNVNRDQQVTKLTGSDTGIYANYFTTGRGNATFAILDEHGQPFTTPIDVRLWQPTAQEGGFFKQVTAIPDQNFRAGWLYIQPTPPPGYTAELQSPQLADPSHVYIWCNGNTHTDIVLKRIGQPPVIDSLTGPASFPELGNGAMYNVQATDPQGSPLTVEWQVSGRGGVFPDPNNPFQARVSAPQAAQLELTVTVRNSFGLTAAKSMTIQVTDAPPQVFVHEDSYPYWGVPLPFTGSILDTHEDVAAGYAATWNFGDGSATEAGTSDTSVDPPSFHSTHAYADPGVYTASLTLDGNDDHLPGTGSTMVHVTARTGQLTNTTAGSQTFGFTRLSAAFEDTVEWATARLAGRTVLFTIAGLGQYTAKMDAAGNASVDALLLPGNYTVTASTPGDALYAPATSGPQALTVTSSDGKVTGGALVTSGGTGGFNVQCANGQCKGELQFHGPSGSYHAATMTALGISPDGRRAWFAGRDADGVKMRVYVEDNGEPGGQDVFRIWIGGVLQNGDGALDGGNIQIH